MVLSRSNVTDQVSFVVQTSALLGSCERLSVWAEQEKEDKGEGKGRQEEG